MGHPLVGGAEVLEAGGGQGGLMAFLVEEGDDGGAAARREEGTDAGDGDAGEGAGKARAGAGGEEQLVVFATVEGVGEGAGSAVTGGEGMEGEAGNVDLGGDAGLLAEVQQIGGEAVAQVDAGGDEGGVTAAEGTAEGEAGLGKGLGAMGAGWARVGGSAAEHGLELGRRAAEGARDPDRIPGPGAGATQGAGRSDLPEQDDVGEEMLAGGLAGVTAGDGDVVFEGEGVQAGEEGIEPAPADGGAGGGGGDGEREKAGERGGAHGGEVAEAAGEAAVAGGASGVGIAAEVAAFDQQIGGDGDLLTGARGEQGAVVTNTERDGPTSGGAEAPAQAADEGELADGHGRTGAGHGISLPPPAALGKSFG